MHTPGRTLFKRKLCLSLTKVLPDEDGIHSERSYEPMILHESRGVGGGERSAAISWVAQNKWSNSFLQ